MMRRLRDVMRRLPDELRRLPDVVRRLPDVMRRVPDVLRRVPASQLIPSLVLMLTVVAGSLGWLPLVVVVAVLYLVPGYLLVTALFGPVPLPRTERWVVAIAMSIVFLALGAQLLNLTPLGITAVGWIVLMILLVVLVVVVSLRANGPVPTAQPLPRLEIGRRDAQLLVAASLVALLAIVVAAQGASLPMESGYTEMWIERGANGQVEVTVRSRELAPTSYTIRIDGAIEDVDATIELRPGASWSTSVQPAANAAAVSAALFREDDVGPYRQVRIVVEDDEAA